MLTTPRFLALVPALLLAAGCESRDPETETRWLSDLAGTPIAVIKDASTQTLTVRFGGPSLADYPYAYEDRCPVFHAFATFDGVSMQADDGGGSPSHGDDWFGNSEGGCRSPTYSVHVGAATKLPAEIVIADGRSTITIFVPRDLPSFELAGGPSLAVGQKVELATNAPASSYEVRFALDASGHTWEEYEYGEAAWDFVVPDQAIERTGNGGLAFVVPAVAAGPGWLSLAGSDWPPCEMRSGAEVEACDVTIYDEQGYGYGLPENEGYEVFTQVTIVP